MDNRNLERLLNQFGKELVQEISSELVKLGKRASGELINSINSDVVKLNDNTLELDIKGEDYLSVIDKGRKKGKKPPIAAIKKWAQIKGIDPKYVYPIAKKIGDEGIEPTNLISKILQRNKQRYLAIIQKTTEKAFADEVVKEIKKETNK